jgi:fructokinase
MIGMMKKAKANIAISLESPAMLEKNRQKALEIAKYADVLFLNDEEMKAIGVNEKTICNLAPLVYLKKGKDGSAVFSSGSKLADIPPYPAKVIDTTGAGDAYAAGVLWALNNTKSEIEAGVIGSKLAAAVISKFGAGLTDNLQEII